MSQRFMTLAKQGRVMMPIRSHVMMRMFASGDNLPPHIKLEMPNLSPTMEKVRLIELKSIGQHR